jgi:hypothetical protein
MAQSKGLQTRIGLANARAEGRGMTVTLTDTVMVPEWAICYIEYGDHSGMDDEEIAMVDEWLSRYTVPTFSYGTDPHFTAYPAFGLACNAVATDVYEHKED